MLKKLSGPQRIVHRQYHPDLDTMQSDLSETATMRRIENLFIKHVNPDGSLRNNGTVNRRSVK